jgi:hypothetical protein
MILSRGSSSRAALHAAVGGTWQFNGVACHSFPYWCRYPLNPGTFLRGWHGCERARSFERLRAAAIGWHRDSGLRTRHLSRLYQSGIFSVGLRLLARSGPPGGMVCSWRRVSSGAAHGLNMLLETGRRTSHSAYRHRRKTLNGFSWFCCRMLLLYHGMERRATRRAMHHWVETFQ